MIESKKYFSSSAYFSSLHEGLSMYEFIKSLIADYSYEVIISKINQVINKVFIASSLLISYGVNTSAKKKISQGLSLLKLGSQSYQPLNLFTPTKGKNVGLLIKENVNINVLSYPLNGIDEKDLYQYYVVQKILSLDYLWNNVRVKNGAYGTALIASDVHSVTFYSEEDPNVKKTYDIFKKFFSYYQKHKISYANLKKYIIATSASLDDPTKLKSIFNSMTIRYLSNLSSKEHERRIQELFENTNVNDIYHLFELLKMDDKDLIYFSVGNKENLSQMDFDQIIELD
jgi:hypothetical protein